jgi:hypothetical protein
MKTAKVACRIEVSKSEKELCGVIRILLIGAITKMINKHAIITKDHINNTKNLKSKNFIST